MTERSQHSEVGKGDIIVRGRPTVLRSSYERQNEIGGDLGE